MKVGILSLLIPTFILLSSITWAASWTEVTHFTGSVGQDTPYFSCTHAEWRIIWNWTLGSQGSGGIVVYVYDNQSSLVTTIIPGVNGTRDGVTYVHNQQGTFYLSISTINVETYTLTIEQDIDSIPEFSPIFLLSLFTLGTITAIILARKQRHLR